MFNQRKDVVSVLFWIAFVAQHPPVHGLSAEQKSYGVGQHSAVANIRTTTSSLTYQPKTVEFAHQGDNWSCHLIRRSALRKVCVSTGISLLAPLLLREEKFPFLSSWSSHALSPEAAAVSYDKYAPNYDQLDGGDVSTLLGIPEARTKLISQAKGRVLEIGVGTGLNLQYYDRDKVDSLTLVDVSDGMLQQAQDKAKSLKFHFPLSFIRADATCQLTEKFGLQEFDTVLDTFSLCVMGNEGARKCLSQLMNVVKGRSQGGQILLLENSRSSSPVLAWYQDITAEPSASLGGKGCLYNQDVHALIKSINGMNLESEETYAMGLFRSFVCTTK